MSSTLSNLSCAEFQAQLPELIASGSDLANDAHLANCPLCRALIADLQTIADAARQLLAPVEPPDELWKQIESALLLEQDSSQN
jgi:predicted anti-sigma-YlaC factor YlaD